MVTKNAPPKAKWWQLYISFPVLLGLFVLDTHLRLSDGGHEALQLGSLLLEFILIQRWLHANSSALNYIDDETYGRTITVIEVSPSPLAAFEGDARGAWLLPPLEIKGVLGDTFEMETMDASSKTAEEAVQSARRG
jgi:hypothetical protein